MGTTGKDAPKADNQMLVDVTSANRQVYYQGYQVGLPTTCGGRQFHRTITSDEFLLSDPDTSEIVFSFPLQMIALQMRDRWVASYAIQGVQLSHPTKPWAQKEAEYREQFAQRRKTSSGGVQPPTSSRPPRIIEPSDSCGRSHEIHRPRSEEIGLDPDGWTPGYAA
ncbi:hypothetical protein [Arthrobacter sp. 179]|uniref:hypothetical protein n=1 Tax=Arthrobacter sp. 179 TaxID=3457734 RepID=UPI0040344C5C